MIEFDISEQTARRIYDLVSNAVACAQGADQRAPDFLSAVERDPLMAFAAMPGRVAEIPDLPDAKPRETIPAALVAATYALIHLDPSDVPHVQLSNPGRKLYVVRAEANVRIELPEPTTMNVPEAPSQDPAPETPWITAVDSAMPPSG